jgi:hypothetical protein
MDYVTWEVEERKLVEEAIDPDGIEGSGLHSQAKAKPKF